MSHVLRINLYFSCFVKVKSMEFVSWQLSRWIALAYDQDVFCILAPRAAFCSAKQKKCMKKCNEREKVRMSNGNSCTNKRPVVNSYRVDENTSARDLARCAVKNSGMKTLKESLLALETNFLAMAKARRLFLRLLNFGLVPKMWSHVGVRSIGESCTHDDENCTKMAISVISICYWVVSQGSEKISIPAE